MLINWGLIMNNLICIQVHVYIQIAKSRVLFFFKGLSSSDVLKGDLKSSACLNDEFCIENFIIFLSNT